MPPKKGIRSSKRQKQVPKRVRHPATTVQPLTQTDTGPKESDSHLEAKVASLQDSVNELKELITAKGTRPEHSHPQGITPSVVPLTLQSVEAIPASPALQIGEGIKAREFGFASHDLPRVKMVSTQLRRMILESKDINLACLLTPDSIVDGPPVR